ncbi:MAG TPA: GNVR domain-containing protein, partial [Burkholderiaceae bacterium]
AQKGIIANDERLDVENQRLNELSSALVTMQAMAAESNSRQSQAQGAAGDRMQEVLNNAVVSGLKADLARSEARLQEMGAKFGDKHPQVLEAKASISELRKRIEQETAKVTGGVVVSNNINRQREAEFRAALDAQRAKLIRMKSVRDEGAVILREVDNAQRSYDALMTRFTQSNIESQATSSNVNLLNSASVPLEASSPRVVFNTLLSIFLGLFLAAGVALGAELRDRRVRAPADIVTVLGLPLLGTLPRSDDKAKGLWLRKLLRQPQAVPRLEANLTKA